MKNMSKKRKIQLLVVAILFVCSFLVTIDYVNFKNKGNKKEYYNRNINTYLANNELDYVYVSDLPFMKAQTAWGQIFRDKTSSNTPITIKVDNSNFSFDKGIWAHADSTIDIDLRNYKQYAYFTTFYGVNETSYNNGNGVKFYIYTSVDGQKWDLQTDANPTALKSSNAAKFVKIDIRDANYLRLVADDNGQQGNDHSVWADSKLIKENYKEENSGISLAEIEEKIKKEYPNVSGTNLQDEKYELLLLQRSFVKEVGEFTLQKFLSASPENVETYKWLTEDLENLRMYMMGGRPDGSYFKSLTVLTELLKNYKSDFAITDTTQYGTVLGNLYKRMAITLSLTHSDTVGLWMDLSSPENISDAVVRYQIYKDLHKNGKFIVSSRQDQTKWFEHLEIEEMRYVLNNIIDDEEILWLNEYTQKFIDEHENQEETYLQPHKYMKYIWPDYEKPEYHDLSKRLEWDAKYGNFNTKYNVTYRPGVKKLWMNLDNGAVCGGISKIGSNIRGVHGTPSSVINQPGHAALIYYRENSDGLGYWTIDNDVSDWPNSNKTEKLSVRMPLGWGDEEYLATTKFPEGVVNYVLLAQGALNDFDKYQTSREIYLQADLYTDTETKLKLYRESVEALPLNIDAWYGIIESYEELHKSEKEFLDLAVEIFDALKYYPLPMYHLGEEIFENLTDQQLAYQFMMAQNKTLQIASVATSKESIQDYAVRKEAQYLLGKIDDDLASFSFDGEDAGKIVLLQFTNSGVHFDYCLEGSACIGSAQNWHDATFTAEEDHKWQLKDEELASITDQNDLYVHIVGVDYKEENLFKIDIQKFNIANANLYANDLENRVVGVDLNSEWRIEGEDTWTSYEQASPNLTGDKNVYIRMQATGTYLASDELLFHFTSDTDTETRKYIPVSHVSVDSFSTEAAGQQRYAKNVLDGNLNTHWHSAWDGSDKEKWIVLKLDYNYYLSALDYVPRPGNGAPGSGALNGRVKTAKIEVSLDGKDWQVVGEPSGWSTDDSVKTFNFDEPVEARYVRFTGVETQGNFITASMFNLYEDSTKSPTPIAEIEYSTTVPTTEDVVARLVNYPEGTVIDGTDTHVFKENGSYTFTFKNKNGVEGSATAVVDWIDRTTPTVKSINYSTKKSTNNEVMAFITFSENVIFDGEVNLQKFDKEAFKDNSKVPDYGENTWMMTFEDNAKYTISYHDAAGNVGEPAKIDVDWIDREAPMAEFTYSTLSKTTDPVTVKLSPLEKNVTILNNDGKDTYTFTKNGSFLFQFRDEAGNIGSALAEVDWIIAKEPESTPQEEEKTPSTAPNSSSNETKDDKDETNTIVEENNPVLPSTKSSKKITSSNNKNQNSTTIEDSTEDTSTSDSKEENDEYDSETNEQEEKEEKKTQSSLEDTKEEHKMPILPIVGGGATLIVLGFYFFIKNKNN